MQYVADLEVNDDGGLQIMYGIDGRRDLSESELSHMTGYAGARPVRVGNGALTSARTTSTGPPSTRSCCTRAAASGCRGGLWPLVQAQAECASGCGANRTKASGRRAASRSTTCRRS